ncbi:MAG: zinc-binding dehydrogenase [Actinomycetota bacterium]|nr:zinc-binding dehydrogenase [Actinomycetota bacterium]
MAAVAGCAVITGVGAALNALDHLAGRSLLVVGAGGVGCAAVMGAVVAGASPIVVIDANDRALDLARSLGATDTLLAGDHADSAIRERYTDGVDCAIEAVGRPETLRLAFSALRPGGTLVGVGLGTVGQDFALPINELVQQEKRVVGSLYGSASPPLELPRIFSLYQSGKLPLDRLLGATYPLEAVNDALSDLVAGGHGRGVLLPGT